MMRGEECERDRMLVSEAIEAFLASPRCTGSGNTYRAYAGVLFRLANQLGTHRPLGDVDDEEIGTALQTLWGTTAPATWNRNRATVGYGRDTGKTGNGVILVW
jgi:hypothetical protein